MQKATRAQVHRFRNAAAIYLGGPTVYMTAAEAKALIRSLRAVVQSLETETFTESTCGTQTFDIQPQESPGA